MHDVLLRAHLAGGQQDVRLFEHCGLIFGVGHEVRSDIALVETHAFGEVQIQAEAVVVLNGHDASWPTLSRASAIFSPTSGSAAEIVAVAAI